jgi:SnoaL-like domain
VEGSPVTQLLAAIDRLDVDAALALAAPDCRLLTVDGRRAQGAEEVRQLLRAFMSSLRSTAHRITSEWHVDDVWIAEVEASYELRDWLQMNDLPRVFVLRGSPNGLVDIRVYGARERPLDDHRTGDEPMRVGGRPLLPL